ncbi:MAG: hypothetical protein AAGD23_11680 [Pseudomonadota bacterium]
MPWRARTFFLTLCGLIGLSTAATVASANTYLQLVERLDRPSDGYCLDVLGAGGTYRPDLPVNAHNCKAGIAPDGLVELRDDGTLYFPAFDRCLTAFGVNRRSLPGAMLLLRGCSVDEPFYPVAALQQWQHSDVGEVRLANSDLCLSVGDVWATTFSPRDTWRVLRLASCDVVAPELSRWQFVDAPLNSN